jgi:hypothetical protein
LLTTSGPSSLWEQWYENASVPQRQQALARAGEQGILFAHQLPTPEGAPAKRAGDSLTHIPGTPSRRPLLTALLHGPAPELEPIRPSPIQPIDSELDEVQRDAVARALCTPDLALIQGYPGTGKSRVIAEILRQSVRAGQRVLFLAISSAGVDRVLDHLAAEGFPGVLRCLGAGETEVGLPASVVPLTSAYRLRQFEQQTIPVARRALETVTTALEARRREEPAWVQLEECVQRQSRLINSLEELKEKRLRLGEVIAAELDRTNETSTWPDWDSARRASREAIAESDARLEALSKESNCLAAQLKQFEEDERRLAPLVEVRQAGRWWTLRWWSALFQGSQLERLNQVRCEIGRINDRLREVRAQEKEWTTRRCHSEEQLTDKRRDLDERERTQRDSHLAGRQAVLEREAAEAAQRCGSLLARLGLDVSPYETTVPAVQAARFAWSAQLAAATQEVSLRQRWLEVLQQAHSSLPAQLAASARIVAANAAGLQGDPFFGDASAGSPFDLLVIDEAQRLGEAELIALASRARRWVLVGDVATDLPLPAPPSRRNGPPRSQPVQARPAFQRLWSQIHCDPRRLPSHWRIAGGQLIGSLRPIAAEQTPWVQHERVFDRPEIELRIVAPPRHEPIVAEVLFSDSTPVEQAKEFIYRELQELSVQAGGPALRWSENDRTVTLHLGARCDCSVTAVTLEAGIREMVTRCVRPMSEPPARSAEASWRTCEIEFDRAEGWDRGRAERWAAERLNLRDSGRSTVLCRSYRACETLAHFLSEVLYGGLWRVPCSRRVEKTDADLRAVEFVPVTAMCPEWRRGSGLSIATAVGGAATATMTPRLRTAKGGAGLEMDLAAPRRVGAAGSLPDELRTALPPQGIVNYAEARAIVEALERLARDPIFAPLANAGDSEARRVISGPKVAVISLFASQVELLRRLIQRSAVLAGSPLAIEVGLPGAFQQREAMVGLVSLTRSHASRAVPFSDTPQSLVAALTQCATRLVLFGDPGTMLRRSQWHGGLDHLDEIVGPIEQALVGQLLGQLNRICEQAPDERPLQDAPARASRSRESSGV